MDGIKLVNVSKFYTVEKESMKVLNGIDLNIPANKITVILGRSGCGKTTLLRLVSGLEEFDQGEILGANSKRKAYVFQEDRLMPWLDVKKNITFGIHNKDIDNSKIDKIIETVGLKKFYSAYPRQLSGGMKQRVSIARAFAYDPDFIMMDEPFSALDFFTREQMQKELLKIHQTSKCSILFVTHSIDEALILGDKIVILEKGVIKSQYEIEEKNSTRDLLNDKFVKLKKQIIDDLNVI
ncbi:taurine-transporting AtPase [[Clostridium] sordellii]|uniref:ABC transporter ATP-binding protein n=1 Tax=Paraclostridium sordellii TaxID=1505 RepID=UPI0005E898BC|nr:ABC transporter ATP-binding protein [Paeniclostridium sordellii]CEO34619.1 taurine-transporting AtPase [[Clostridium] sordellii] [Paeniclostridium sordellii]CEP93369.1 taurine-transporting AtPase [[Clostridium] sordellii] [Paeniclostridium sordellii]CEQ16532.1 taurine-transporting AtPase [[Clostridium] sordellii] [Paeniclostridium sordellii]CEQ26186.1 taurine-transporting AtPase [[Clostridium] sordellii] [Paeniclostridium sordellii]CEQ29917.1 taurine-transporting AtPase [[Clostridium] sorde